LANEKIILIAEDDDISYKLIVNFLRKFKYPIHWTKNGWDTYLYCMKKDVQLVLMDMKMPVMDGFQAVSLIKKNKPSIKIIAQTAYSMRGDREKCLDAGCDDYISKPLVYEEFLDMVEKYLTSPTSVINNV